MLQYLFLLQRLKKKTSATTRRDMGQKLAALNCIATGARVNPIAIIVGPITTGVINFLT